MGATFADLLPDLGPLGHIGIGALMAALALAPVLGGLPGGAAYGNDTALGLLRILVLLAALCLLFSRALSDATRPHPFRAAARPSLPSPNHPQERVPGRGVSEVSPTSASPTTLRDSPSPLPALGEGPGVRAGTTYLVWALFALTLLSLLVHSRVFTNNTLLFAMLPATLDGLCYALAFTLALQLSQDRKAFLLLLAALLAGAAWATVSGVREYGQQVQLGNPSGRAKATFLSENFAAGFLGLCLPVAVAVFLRARSLIGVVGSGALAGLMAGVLVATGSRGGVGAALAGLVAALLLAIAGRVRLPWARVGVLVVLVLVLGAAFRAPLLGRVGSGASEQEHSGSFRRLTWQGTLAMAEAHPTLGTGPGTFAFRYPPFARVARTDLAHSSYLQTAAETGFPALAAAGAALVLVLIGAGVALLRGTRSEMALDDTRRLLRCALWGGLLTGILRSALDSEWSLLGNALPFWSVAGLLAGANGVPTLRGVGAKKKAAATGLRVLAGAGLAIALVLALLLFRNAVARNAATALVRQDPGAARARLEAAARAWPPDPSAIALLGRLKNATELLERAARIEPSGRRFYQLARAYQEQNRSADAIAAYERAARAEPTSLQTLRALAEAQTAQGDIAGALASWRRLVAVQEGPAGQIRAIPELPEIHPAYAYAALADDARARGDNTAAERLYEKAAAVVEDYADTTPPYQMSELALAQAGGASFDAAVATVRERRRDLAALYRRVMVALRLLAGPQNAGNLQRREAETLAQLAKFVADNENGAKGAP